jgi:porphobilinogen synthase
MASTVSFSPANVQMLQARSSHSHATFGTCSAVPRTGLRLRSTAVRVRSEQEASAAVRAPSGRTIEECEADAVAGKFPAPPPFVTPKAPEGTPEIRPLVCSPT